MASCAYCNTMILFGGKKQGELRFCNAECQKKGVLASVAGQIPEQEVSRYLAQVHQGVCPQCKGQGPVDVHTSYRVWSALILTSWSSRPAVCCRGCGIKRALGDTLFSAVLGWWGFPWGIVMTPIQVVRNVGSLLKRPDPTRPTPALQQMVRLHLASAIVSSQSRET